MPTLDQFLSHPIATLERALHIRKQIDQLNEALREIFGPTSASLLEVQPTTTPKRRGKRRMSAEAKARIAAAQRARWAKQKGMIILGPSPVAKKKRGGMSAEGRARIAAAQKARWAKVRAGKFTSPTAPAKGKRKISAAHRAKLKAAAKARWARVKKGKS